MAKDPAAQADGLFDGRWRTDATEQAEAAMRARLDAVRGELADLRAEVADARHPWNWYLAGSVVAAVFVAFGGFAVHGAAGSAGLLVGVGMVAWTVQRKLAADRVLAEARAPLDALLRERVLDLAVLDGAQDELMPFTELGVFGRFDDVASLDRLSHAGRELLDVRLTREDRRTVTDAQGRTRTETTTVTVFNGLLFTLPFPDVPGNERVVISSEGRPSPRGRFDRRDPAGKRRKLEKLGVAAPAFSKRYRLYADDPVTGHLVADPDRVMRFLLAMDDLRGTLRRRRPPEITALVTEGRMWVAMSGVDVPKTGRFHEGEALERELSDTLRAVSIPAVLARHLRV